MDSTLFRLFICSLSFCVINSTPLPHESVPDRQYPYYNETGDGNKTFADLVQKQTDTIKKIVTDQQQQSRVEYPVITRYGVEEKQKVKQENAEKIAFEELKIKCQHLSRLAVNNRSDQEGVGSNQNKTYNKVKVVTRRPVNGFYITTEATTTTKKPPPPDSPKPAQNVKYIKLEPVILQKTILSDGRIIYYWHKSLPSAVQIPSNTLQPQTSSNTPTPPPTTTSSSYDFRNFFPSFYSFRSPEQVSEVTTEKTTTTTTPATITTTTTTTEKQEELLYTQQLRFVVPVPYANAENAGVRRPWEFDQFAYYPKPLQPETVNVEMPYVPTFHIIKALAVPNKNEDYSAIDNVNI